MKSLIATKYNWAKEFLETEGYQLQIRYTRPPRNNIGLGELRVVGQQEIDSETIELIIANEDYIRVRNYKFSP